MTGIPGYWTNETSGVLRPVVVKYLEGAALDPEELATMRAYLRQWVEAPGFGGKDTEILRGSVGRIHSNAALRRWLEAALDAGIDPL